MLHELKPNTPRKARKRIGRGIGSGTGKTAGKGHKGQLARSGGRPRPGFEGGQMPLFQRLPKRGFNNINRKEYAVVNIGVLDKNFKDGDVVTREELAKKGLIKTSLPGLKVLANGKLSVKLTVKANLFSKKAEEAITKVGGTYEVI